MTTQQFAHLLYNGRSSALSESFIKPSLSTLLMTASLKSAQAKFEHGAEIQIRRSDMPAIDDTEDIMFTADELASVALPTGFSADEQAFMLSRSLHLEDAKRFGLFGMSMLAEHSQRDLDILGYSVHPALRKHFKESTFEGICIPHFNSAGVLDNMCIRRLSDAGKFKYTLAVPDATVWLSITDNTKPLWTCEGLFDYIALVKEGENAATVSSASWSDYQLGLLHTAARQSKLPGVYSFADNDWTGIRSALVIQTIFDKFNKGTSTIRISDICKDPCAHILEQQFELSYKMRDMSLSVAAERWKSMPNTISPFNWLDSLKNRQFA